LRIKFTTHELLWGIQTTAGNFLKVSMPGRNPDQQY
jgi:hypothetical protein